MKLPLHSVASKKLIGHIEITDHCCWEIDMLQESVSLWQDGLLPGSLRLYVNTSLEKTADGPLQQIKGFIVSYAPPHRKTYTLAEVGKLHAEFLEAVDYGSTGETDWENFTRWVEARAKT